MLMLENLNSAVTLHRSDIKSHGDENSSETTKKSQSNLIEEGRVYVEPTDDDILRGRGGKINAHPGKQKLLDLVRKQGERYASLKRGEKGRMGKEIVDEVRSWGGRFLEMEKGSDGIERYYEVDERAAIKLVEQKFRDDPSKRKTKSTEPRKRKEPTNRRSKLAIQRQKARVCNAKKIVNMSKTIAAAEDVTTFSDSDKEDIVVEMDQHSFPSPCSRILMVAQLNAALSGLEPSPVALHQSVETTESHRHRCVSPTHSYDVEGCDDIPPAPLHYDMVDQDEYSLSAPSSSLEINLLPGTEFSNLVDVNHLANSYMDDMLDFDDSF